MTNLASFETLSISGLLGLFSSLFIWKEKSNVVLESTNTNFFIIWLTCVNFPTYLLGPFQLEPRVMKIVTSYKSNWVDERDQILSHMVYDSRGRLISPSLPVAFLKVTKSINGPKSRGTSFGTKLWRYVQKYCMVLWSFVYARTVSLELKFLPCSWEKITA